MEVLLEDIKRTLGANRIYLPGSEEEAKYIATRSRKRAVIGKEDSLVNELEVAVEGLGIIDSAVDITQAPVARRSRLELPPLTTSGEADKENLGVLRSRVIKVKEGRRGQLEMVGVPSPILSRE
jgi:hypothetical protein